MKKIILSMFGLCLTLLASAEPIGKQAALFTAQNFMLAKGKTVEAQPQSSRAKASAGESDYYYVFNAGGNGGYVIVSGDDRTEPILGYVEQGSFDPDNIPENMRSLLQLYADEIKYIVDNDIQQGDPRIKTRNKVAGTRHSIGEMLTTRWNQGKPYNITCPNYYKEDDEKEETALPLKSGPATGCTATAMAQVMYFYKYPDKVKKEIPAYSITYTSKKNGSKKTTDIPKILRNTVIDWDNMRDTYSWPDGHVANKQDSAVANLMRYCGQAVKMHYGPSSGANFSAEAYINYFGYADGAYVGERRDYTIDHWFNSIYDELDRGYPVLISGFSSGGGHAFVIDGFDGDNLFHLNWGWGGGSNGWFLVGILNPGDNSGMGASSSSDGYSMSQRALFNLRIPGTPKTDAYLTISDVNITGTSIKAKYTNQTGATGSFNAGIVMLNDDGSLSLVGSKQNMTSLGNGSSTTKTFLMKGKLPEGTYRLSPASKPSRGEEWQAEYDFQTQYIEAVVDSLGEISMRFHKPQYTGTSISIDTIAFPGSQVMKEQQEIKVTFRNNGKEYYQVIYLHASLTSKKVYTKSKSVVAVRSGETVDVSYFFTPDTTGIYNLWFCTGEDGSGVIGEGTMEVYEVAQGDKPNLSVSSYTITNAVSNVVYGKTLIGKASIRNNKNTDFHGIVKLQIWNQPNSTGSAWSGSTHSYEVDILAGKVASVDFSFNVVENNKYYIKATYSNQKEQLGNGGVWDLGGWEVKSGVELWKNDGTPTGKAYANSISLTTQSTICGVYADCSKKISRMTPNKNPNTIYAFGENMELPSNLTDHNVVHGKHAEFINLVSDHPYYLTATFKADNASYSFTFPENEEGTGWHAITMPFTADAILIDDIPADLNDPLKHFWIYEFAAQSLSGNIVFKPATTLRGGTPYIIAADETMAGRSIVFTAQNAPFYKTGTDKMVVTSLDYKFHGNTITPRLRNCYVLNAEGTAFEYTTTNKTLPAQASYFTTELPDEERLASIQLPPVPEILKKLTLDEMVASEIVADTYDKLTVKRSFDAGYNTICLPFRIDNVKDAFGQDIEAYEFQGIANDELLLQKTESLTAGQPYIIVFPEATNLDIICTNITIEEGNTEAGFVEMDGGCFFGTYAPIFGSDIEKEIYSLAPDGKVVKFEPDLATTGAAVLLKGFRAYFELGGTGIKTIEQQTADNRQHNIYNLAGQRLGKAQKGVNIVNGKKIYIR
ncbi:MAG: C10 family peptidase [Bacteroidaceae bacterium]|nr:C10 family peptidase [Bacteroidaceae bacterium]